MSAWDIIYYTYCLSALGFLICLIASVHKPMWYLYCVQSTLQGIYFAALDQDLSRWFGIPAQYQDLLELVTGVLVASYAFWAQARLIQQDHEFAIYKPHLRGLATLTLLLLPLALIVAPATLHSIAVVLVLIAIASLLIPPLTWGFLPKTAQRVAMPIIVVTALSAAMLLIFRATLFELTPGAAETIRHWIMVWSVSAGVVTMLYMTLHIERTRQHAANRAIRAAKKEGELQRKLYETEVQHNHLRELAVVRGEQLESVAHDLRQPLFSLRSSLDLLLKDQSTQVSSQVREALEYADRLAESYMDTNRHGLDIDQAEATQGAKASAGTAQPAETVSLEVYFETLEHMFSGQAAQADVDLQMVGSSLEVNAPPVNVMRILSNLIANALEHANATRLVVGCRRLADGACLEVHDNGCGIDQDSLQHLQEAGGKGPESNGNGLGLAIVAKLCEQCGFGWQPTSMANRGTIMRVHIPLAALSAKRHNPLP